MGLSLAIGLALTAQRRSGPSTPVPPENRLDTDTWRWDSTTVTLDRG
jgi:hypothetical protein